MHVSSSAAPLSFLSLELQDSVLAFDGSELTLVCLGWWRHPGDRTGEKSPPGIMFVWGKALIDDKRHDLAGPYIIFSFFVAILYFLLLPH